VEVHRAAVIECDASSSFYLPWLTENQIEQVLSGLRDNENGQWEVQLPKACIAFGQPIVLSLDTGTLRAAPPPPHASELDLCRRILANLTKVIDAAAASYLAYHGPEFPDAPRTRGRPGSRFGGRP
jgi:hypothetical protein